MPVMTNDDIVGTRADYGTLARMELDFANKHMGVFGVDYSPKVIAALCNAILALELERNTLLGDIVELETRLRIANNRVLKVEAELREQKEKNG